jgi:glycosyltransferase involved in cell wall biosynthesis
MKILYDHQAFSNEKFGGVSKYFCELMKNIPAENQVSLSLVFSDNQYLKEDYNFFKKTIIPWSDKEFSGKGFLKRRIDFLNRQYSRYSISSNKYDLFHPTFYDGYFLGLLKRPYIITVHDLIVFKFKDTLYRKDDLRRRMEKEVIKNANRIISISQNTKKDIVDIFGIHPEKIDVIYHGFNRPEVKTKPNPYGAYVLYVGRRGGYKNFRTFVKAISNLLKKEKEMKLICVGEPFNKEEMTEMNELQILSRSFAVRVDEKTLNNLYSNALVFVYPSLYEGFGMPVLEAFANDCPVCLSNTSCFPEIAGDAVLYFDPRDHESILETIKKVLYDDRLKEQMINAGKKRLVNFSWAKTGEETIISYKKTIME